MICHNINTIIKDNLTNIKKLRNTRTLKNDNSYVTEGDLLCQKLITGYIHDNFKNKYKLVSEEIDNSSFVFDPNTNYVVIDPIDGTENFTSGLKEWGTAICVYENGAHTESALILPELNEFLKTGDKIEYTSSRILGISSSLTKDELLNLPTGFEYRISGCCVYNMLNVIKGSFVSFENQRGAKSWDILPGLHLALEHGLTVIVNGEKYDGKFLDPNKKYRFKISR